MVLTALRCGIVRFCGLSCGSVLRWSSPGLLGSSPLLSALLGSPGFSRCLCEREESGNGPRDRRIEKLWPRLNLIWRSILTRMLTTTMRMRMMPMMVNLNVMCALSCAALGSLGSPGVFALLCSSLPRVLSWALLRSPVPCSPGLFLALLRWPHLAFSSALLGSPVLCSPVLGPALSCARLCSPVLSCAFLFLADRG